MKKIVVIIISVLIVISTIFLFVFKDNKKEKTIEDMTLREKIGQMLMAYYTLDEIDDDLIESLKTNQPGGFIVTGDNLKEYKRTKKFLTSLNKYTDIDMIIAVDQEGGSVQRLNDIKDIKSTPIPNGYEIGKLNNLDVSYNIGKIIGTDSGSLGINAVFSPVCDIGDYETSAMDKRLISNDTSIVTNNSYQIYKGIESTGLISIPKHFPGIGDTDIDTHYDELTIINKTKEELYEKELKPFIKLIDNNAKMIMVGHAIYPKISQDELPASLSKEIITDILINELKFDGIVITDAINMGALAYHYNEIDIYTKAINAGVNMFIMPNGTKRVIDLIEKEVKNGNIDENKINESVRRILKVKKSIKKTKLNNYGSNYNKNYICKYFNDYCNSNIIDYR